MAAREFALVTGASSGLGAAFVEQMNSGSSNKLTMENSQNDVRRKDETR
jgi:short-subunit dehydrogenase